MEKWIWDTNKSTVLNIKEFFSVLEFSEDTVHANKEILTLVYSKTNKIAFVQINIEYDKICGISYNGIINRKRAVDCLVDIVNDDGRQSEIFD
jgi:hypothetical protein